MRMSKYTAEIVWEWEEQCFAVDVWEFMRVVWCSVRVVERGSVIEVAEGVRVVWGSQNIFWGLCEVVWGCVRVFYYWPINQKQNTDMTNAKTVLVRLFFISFNRQTLHIQNRYKNGHDMTNAYWLVRYSLLFARPKTFLYKLQQTNFAHSK